ncbi:hypothetical protein H634G_06606 [Metarhizium anisopliae BRIP 53293]|uniref:Uncharacterized protein n=1 Tax=Metarhizium anisopliae BRIP 53293 TaxID=1291518 RepID=A0A0D9NW63_METAN|nr:hypothetical protein H634G_06606 [Metarhizium anisopliae BRIP 53293]KJK95529.1 hypothetical protein H633G_00600 [Metarhizium anisopliae BRIP 53284]
MTIYQNRDFFELFNQVRANFKSVALKVDEKIVERYKAKFAEVAKTPASPNEVLTEAESLGEKIRQVVAKVQNDIDAKTALKSNELKFPLYLGTINAIDVADLNELEGEAIALEVPVLEKSAAKLAEIQSQVEAQLEKLRPNAEANPGEKDKQDKDKDKGQDNGSKGQDQNNGIKEQDRNNGSKEKEQDKADKKRVIEERTKVADQVATTSGNSWAQAAATGGSFTVGGITIFSAPVSLQVSDAEVAAVLQELLPEVTNDAITVSAETLRPPTPMGNVQIPVLARKRAQAQDETPEVKRWRVAALAIIAQQAIRDSLEEALKQAQQDMGNKAVPLKDKGPGRKVLKVTVININIIVIDTVTDIIVTDTVIVNFVTVAVAVTFNIINIVNIDIPTRITA